MRDEAHLWYVPIKKKKKEFTSKIYVTTPNMAFAHV